MRPDVRYDQLVELVCKLASEHVTYPHNNSAYGNTSQQLRDAVEHVARMENTMMRFSTLITEAQQMVSHPGGSSYGSIKRTTKTNTLTVK